MMLAHLIGAAPVPPPITEQAEALEDMYWFFVALASVVGLLVAGSVAWVVIRYRRRDARLPSQRQYNDKVEVAYTVIPLLTVIFLFFVSLTGIRKTEASPPPDVTINITAYQWQWQFDYPATGARSVSVDLDHPELALPTNSTVEFVMNSRDVIHSFWVPGFRYKRDIFPGQTARFTVDVGDTTGTWVDSGSCAEFCGLDHFNMRFTVSVMSPEDFATWQADHQASGPGIAADGEAAASGSDADQSSEESS